MSILRSSRSGGLCRDLGGADDDDIAAAETPPMLPRRGDQGGIGPGRYLGARYARSCPRAWKNARQEVGDALCVAAMAVEAPVNRLARVA